MKRTETKGKAKAKADEAPHHVGEGREAKRRKRETNEGNPIKTWMFNEWFFWVKQQSNTFESTSYRRPGVCGF